MYEQEKGKNLDYIEAVKPALNKLTEILSPIEKRSTGQKFTPLSALKEIVEDGKDMKSAFNLFGGLNGAYQEALKFIKSMPEIENSIAPYKDKFESDLKKAIYEKALTVQKQDLEDRYRTKFVDYETPALKDFVEWDKEFRKKGLS